MELITLEEVDSTNNYAKKNLKNFSDKTVIRALRQISGRGRLNRRWVDLGENNLFLSVVLKPSETFSSVYTNLTQYLSVILCQLFEEYGLHPEIKWPNDVLINGKKIAGILCETIMQGAALKGLVLGVGINLNSTSSELVSIPGNAATSVNLEIDREVNPDNFLDKFLKLFFKNYDEFLEKGFEFIKSDYLSRACFLNKQIQVEVLNETKYGIAKFVNDSGELVLYNNGKEFTLNIGDIL